MKYLITLLFALVILVSCQNTNSSADNSTAYESAKLRNAFLPILTGDWVQVSYMDTLKQTKSPYNSQDALAEIVEFNIGRYIVTGDSMEIGAINIHEGTNLLVYFKPGKLATSLPMNLKDYDNKSNFYELGYTTSNNDTFLVLYEYNADNTIISQTKYSKVPIHNEGAFQYTVNKTLFSGNYEWIDSAGNHETIQLTNDGTVKGIPNYTKYYVLTDFVAETDSSTDEICFDIQTKGQICYTYIFDKDTLSLYPQIKDENGNFLKLGDVKYTLLKKPK